MHTLAVRQNDKIVVRAAFNFFQNKVLGQRHSLEILK